MSDNSGKIIELQNKLEMLLNKHASFQKELNSLRSEIQFLKVQDDQNEVVVKGMPPETHHVEPAGYQEKPAGYQEKPAGYQEKPAGYQEKPAKVLAPEASEKEPAKIKTDIEKFIGENLISKIGITITIIGVGIGAKYAIDHDLISPWTRIILGYLVGAGLFGFAIYLRKRYANFSAVLLSGSMAITYFITFAAYTFYSLIPLLPTFVLMTLFTVFTVAAAITYNKQVIAHIGLVGAYAVPFLLGDKSGNVITLFSYVAIINIGILVIAYKKYWKPLYYSSFILTWLIFLTWYIPGYKTTEHFAMSLVFISLFFTTFYIISLAYKLVRKEIFEIEDILLLLANSAVFYGLGYDILHAHHPGEDFLGVFTLANALVNLVVAVAIYLRKPADRNLLAFVTGLAIIFATIAIPVQLDGKWVTMLWAVEVAILFWIGRTKNAMVYESLSYPMMFLVFCSLLIDWHTVYNSYDPAVPGTRIIPLFNVNFLTSAIFVTAFSFINFFNRQIKHLSALSINKMLTDIMNFTMPAILLIAVYLAFVMELTTFWNQLYIDSMVIIDQDLTVPKHIWNQDIESYSTITIFAYTLTFLSVLSFINILRLKSSLMGLINLALNGIAVGLFLSVGLFAIGHLRESFLNQELSGFYYRGIMNIGIRYFSFLFLGMMLFSIYKYIREPFLKVDFKMEFDFLLHAAILTVAANELINWMDLFRSEQSYKLGLSILFGVYALILISLGIWKKKKYLRVGAIVLFGATLVKLFIYDLSDLNTISKTIVFVSLGILLLIISFLYNKYKKLIFDQD